MQEITASDFDQEVLGSDVPVIVDFWAPGCGPCTAIVPVLEEIEAGSTFKVVKVDAMANRELANTYEVMTVPSVLIFQEGKLVGRHNGFATKNVLLQKISSFIS